MKRKQSARALRQHLDRSHQLAITITASNFPLTEFSALQAWQRTRLRNSYTDLLIKQKFRAAGRFFLDELYGGEDFIRRDQDVDRVYPVMSRLLPADMLQTLANAMALQVISIDFDIRMTRRLVSMAIPASAIDQKLYGDCYRAVGRHRDRQRQIELILDLGHDLNRIVQRPIVVALIKLMHGPAHAAGFGALQNFLESGLKAFKLLGDGTKFIDTIAAREAEFARRLRDAHPDPQNRLTEVMG